MSLLLIKQSAFCRYAANKLQQIRQEHEEEERKSKLHQFIFLVVALFICVLYFSISTFRTEYFL